MLGPIAGYTPRFPSCQVTCHCQRWSLVAPKAGRLLPLRLVTCCPEGSSHVGPKAGHLLGVRLVTCCPFGWAPVAPEAGHLFPLRLVTCCFRVRAYGVGQVFADKYFPTSTCGQVLVFAQVLAQLLVRPDAAAR